MAAPDLHVEERGAGSCIVLAHAGYLDSRSWRQALVAFSDGHRVVAFDARGTGRSSAADEPYSPADDLLGVLDAIGVARAHLVGVSLGACTVLEAAHRHPERALSATLVSLSMGDEASGELAAQLELIREAFAARDRERIVEQLTSTWFDGRRDVAHVDVAERAVVRELWNPAFVAAAPRQRWRTLDELAELGPLQVPALFVTGSRDWPEILASSEETRLRLAPAAESIVIDPAAHLVQLDQPDGFFEIVDSFVERHDRDG